MSGKKIVSLALVPARNKPFLDAKAIDMETKAVLMARCGFAYAYIQERTGLTAARIALRLGLLGIQLKHWRNGESELAQKVERYIGTDSAGISKKLEDMIYENRLLQEHHHEERMAKLANLKNITARSREVEDAMKRRQIARG